MACTCERQWIRLHLGAEVCGMQVEGIPPWQVTGKSEAAPRAGREGGREGGRRRSTFWSDSALGLEDVGMDLSAPMRHGSREENAERLHQLQAYKKTLECVLGPLHACSGSACALVWFHANAL